MQFPPFYKNEWTPPSSEIVENAHHLDHQLKPIVIHVKSYIEDPNDFLKKLRDLPDLPEESIICTIDVVGLYTSISNEEGLRFIRKKI